MENMVVTSGRDTARDLEQQIWSNIANLKRKYQTTHNRKLNNLAKKQHPRKALKTFIDNTIENLTPVELPGYVTDILNLEKVCSPEQ
ncbi:hypothetical protein WA026_001108 [Henosepilachna vigintioctopunctata]|uniref:Uncharacterized protein n=1 Tax=Henosepilachna vigintioctopunctata TaxID=420089 RepID=A0AAW1V9A5_9CUCU